MSEPAKILIADDEQECIDFVREALADTPHEVIAAMDGQEALKMAKGDEIGDLLKTIFNAGQNAAKDFCQSTDLIYESEGIWVLR